MTSIGKQLKAAREARGMTLAQVAEATRIKSTQLAAMERDDFVIFASPIYARGFIKLYAECVELDAGPLLAAYNALAAPAPRPSLQADREPAPARRDGASRRAARAGGFGEAAVRLLQQTFTPARRRMLGIGAGVLLVVLFSVLGIRQAVRSARGRPRPPAREAVARGLQEADGFPLLERPPDPYVDSDSFGVAGDAGR